MPSLTFKNIHLEPIEQGSKRCTVRFDKRWLKYQPGAQITLAFGARTAPTIRYVTLERVEELELSRLKQYVWSYESRLPPKIVEEAAEAAIARHLDKPQVQLWLKLRRIVNSQTLQACKASGGSLSGLFFEAEGRERDVAVMIWFAKQEVV